MLQIGEIILNEQNEEERGERERERDERVSLRWNVEGCIRLLATIESWPRTSWNRFASVAASLATDVLWTSVLRTCSSLPDECSRSRPETLCSFDRLNSDTPARRSNSPPESESDLSFPIHCNSALCVLIQAEDFRSRPRLSPRGFSSRSASFPLLRSPCVSIYLILVEELFRLLTVGELLLQSDEKEFQLNEASLNFPMNIFEVQISTAFVTAGNEQLQPLAEIGQMFQGDLLLADQGRISFDALKEKNDRFLLVEDRLNDRTRESKQRRREGH